MSTALLYLGETSGGRILRYGTGMTDVTASGTQDVLLEAETHDLIPAGDVGDVIFREADISLRATNGYVVDVTPILDGEDLTTQRFSGSGNAVAPAQAYIAERGNRLRVRFEMVSRAGDVELQQIEVAFAPLRETP